MRLALIIHAHNQWALLDRLLTRVHAYVDDIYLHVDRYADGYDPAHFVNIHAYGQKVNLVRRKKSKWGTVGQILATIESMKAVVESKKYYDKVLLVSGQDYPIKSRGDFVGMLNNMGDADCIRYWRLPYRGWVGDSGGLDRIYKRRYRVGRKTYVFPANTSGKDGVSRLLLSFINRCMTEIDEFPIPLYGGYSWWNLSMRTIKKILIYLDDNKWYLKRFKRTHCGDEIFFQTIIMHLCENNICNAPVNDDLRFVDWESDRLPLPAILDMSDYESIANSNALFARKMDYVRSQNLLDTIDVRILGQ